MSHRTPGLQKSRERSLLVPVSLTHPTLQASRGHCIKGCCWGAFLAAFQFLSCFGDMGEVFLKGKGNKRGLKEIEFLCWLREQTPHYFPSKAATSNLEFLSLGRAGPSPAKDVATHLLLLERKGFIFTCCGVFVGFFFFCVLSLCYLFY